MICRKSSPSLSDLPVFLAMSELFYTDMMRFSGWPNLMDSAFVPSSRLQKGSAPTCCIDQFVEKNFSKIETRPKPEKSIEYPLHLMPL